MHKNTTSKLPKEFHLNDDFPFPTFEEWKAKVEKDLKGRPYEKLIRKTIEGISLNPIYTSGDLKGKAIEQYPYTGSRRGESSVYDWLINQEIDVTDVSEFNSALKKALNRGQNSITIIFNKMKKNGLSVNELSDFGKMLNGIDITKYPFFVECDSSALPFLELLSAYCKQEGIELNKISGHIAADPIGYFAEKGELPVSINPDLLGIKESLEWTKANAPLLKTCNVSTIPYAESGASSVQELAYMLATAAEYIRGLLDLGIPLEEIVPNISVTLGIGSSFFTEIAKFRAARILWRNLISAFDETCTYNGVDLFAASLQFNKTVLDPYVNMLRGTAEAFAAIAGGAKGIRILPFNSPFSPSDDFSGRIARNTQIILKEEARFSVPVDSAGGSYFVETLTDELAKAAWKKFQEIEKNGGMIESLKNGYIRKEVDAVYNERLEEIAKCKSVIVGTNKYVNPKEEIPEEAGNTVVEIPDAFGEPQSNDTVKIIPFEKRRLALPFEKLRIRGRELAVKLNGKPRVYLLRFGNVKEHKPRTDFARGFFEVGGFEVIISDEFNDCETAVDSVNKSGSKIVVICSSDEKYSEIVPKFTTMLKGVNADIVVVLAGNPKAKEEEYRKNGVDEFIFMNANALNLLSDFLDKYEREL